MICPFCHQSVGGIRNMMNKPSAERQDTLPYLKGAQGVTLSWIHIGSNFGVLGNESHLHYH